MSEKEATYEEFSELLAQPREILLQIVNNLDPKSFLKLASTCKCLLNFCQNSKGIHVVFKVPRLYVVKDNEGNILYDFVLSPHDETSRKYMDQLRKWPFTLCIDEVQFYSLNHNFTWDRMDEEIKAHFLTIGVKKIRRFNAITFGLQTARDVEYLTKFVKTFGIECVGMHNAMSWNEAFEACLELPVLELCFFGRNRDLNFDAVLQCSIPTLTYDVNLNLEQFGKIFEMWKTRNGLKSWKFRCDHNFNIMPYFDDWEILRFTSAGPIDPNRRLVFMEVINEHHEYNEKKFFYLLRNDGNVLRFFPEPYFIGFNICPIDEAPPALRAFLV